MTNLLAKIFEKKKSTNSMHMQNTISPLNKTELNNPGIAKMEKYLLELSKSISKVPNK